MAEAEHVVATASGPAANAVAPSASYIEGGRRVRAGRATAWLREGWKYFSRQPAVWALVALIFGAILIGLQYIPAVGSLATILLVPVFAAGLVAGCQAIERGGEIELAHLFAGFRRNTGQLALVGLIGFGLTFAAMLPTAALMGPSV